MKTPKTAIACSGTEDDHAILWGPVTSAEIADGLVSQAHGTNGAGGDWSYRTGSIPSVRTEGD